MAVYRLAFKQALFGVSCVNVFHYETITPPSSNPEKALADGFIAQKIPSYVATLSSNWSGLCVDVVEIGPGSPVPVTVLTPGTVGAETGNALPPNAVAVISDYTATFSASGRGHHFISGVPEDDEADNAWLRSRYDELKVLAIALGNQVAGVPDGAFGRVVYGGIPPTAKPVEKVEVRAQVRILRSRTMKLC